jgi:homoserine dehydrogenase
LPSARALRRVVHEIYRELRAGSRVVAVVSAFGETTDRLLRLGARGAASDPLALAQLAATGEAKSVALLALELAACGIPASALDPDQSGLRARGSVLDADPVAVDVAALRRELDRGRVVVIPGFIARDAEGRTVCLGRGGSDLTALFVAAELGAGCRLVKDKDGIYDRDPDVDGRARRFSSIAWEDARSIGGRIVQQKTIDHASRRRLSFEVGAIGASVATRVGSGPTRFGTQSEPRSPLRVALLGLGTVGGGVWRELTSRPREFEVVAALARRRAIRREVPSALLADSGWEALDADPDVVVELIGGTTDAAQWIEHALERGIDVVTANKRLLAEHGVRLQRLAAAHGARLRFSASVGGALPALETARRLRRGQGVRAIEAVLNGTCNLVLELFSGGRTFEEALAVARERGVCEADPTLDLDGTDAADKLAILARETWSESVELTWSARRGVLALDEREVRDAATRSLRVKLVARARREGRRIVASVEPETLAADHPLATVLGCDNRIVFETETGHAEALSGTGAGRTPTALAVVADLLDLYREGRAARLARTPIAG